MNLLAQGLRDRATLWIGGIFFALIALRPAAQELLQPEERLRRGQEPTEIFPASMGAHQHPYSWLLPALFQIRGVCKFAALLASDAYHRADNGGIFCISRSLRQALSLIDNDDMSATSDV